MIPITPGSTASEWFDNLIFGLPTGVLQMSPAITPILREKEEEKRTRLRALLKGLVYTGGGYAATRLVFGGGDTPAEAPAEPTDGYKFHPPSQKKASAFLIRRAMGVWDA